MVTTKPRTRSAAAPTSLGTSPAPRVDSHGRVTNRRSRVGESPRDRRGPEPVDARYAPGAPVRATPTTVPRRRARPRPASRQSHHRGTIRDRGRCVDPRRVDAVTAARGPIGQEQPRRRALRVAVDAARSRRPARSPRSASSLPARPRRRTYPIVGADDLGAPLRRLRVARVRSLRPGRSPALAASDGSGLTRAPLPLWP